MKKEKIPFSFKLIIAYLFFEFVRPQGMIPVLGLLRIPMMIQIALIFQLIKNKAFNLRNMETKCYIALLIVMVFHVPFAHNNYWAFHTSIWLIQFFVVYLSFLAFIDHPKKMEWIVFTIVLTGIFCAIYGNFHEGKIPGSGFMGDENDFALFLNMCLPLAFFKGFYSKEKSKKIFYFLAVLALIFGTIASKSRGGFVGLVTVLGYCWFRSPKKIQSAAVIAVLVIIGLCFVPKDYIEEIKTLQYEVNKTEESNREYYWRMGWYMFLDRPLFGVGPNNFPWVIEKYEPPGGHAGRYHGSRPAHSLYFTLLPELGLAGVVFFLGMLVVSTKDKYKYEKQIKYLEKNMNSLPLSDENRNKLLSYISFLKPSFYGLSGAIVGYLVTGTFLSVLYYPYFWLFMGITVARNNTCKRMLQETQYFIKQSGTEGI